MPVKKMPAASSSILDVLERVLDRGIVIDAWVGVSVAGIRLLELDTRIVVASLETFLSRGDELSSVVGTNRPALKFVSLTVAPHPRRPIASPPPPRVSLPRTRRGRRRRLSPQRTAAPPPLSVLRCENGCTFESPKTTGAAPASRACPYRQRTRCPVVAV
jgi:hypothetical protein